MIISCLAALQLFAASTLSQYPDIATYNIKTCQLNTESKRSWVEVQWRLKESGFSSRVTLNHKFDPDSCRIEKIATYVDDKIFNKRMTPYENHVVRRFRSEAHVYLLGFIRSECRKNLLKGG